jgi:hypothetical protein
MSKYSQSADYQRNVSAMVGREVIYCVSSLMSELIGKADHFPDYSDDLYSACEGEPDYKEAAKGDCWEQSESGVFFKSPDNPVYFAFIDCDADDTCIVRVSGWDHPLADEDGYDSDNPVWKYTGLSSDAPCDVSDVSELQDYLRKAGVISEDSCIFDDPDDMFETSDAESWQELCEEECIDCDDTRGEIYEHWIVSNWLGRKLTESGEKVIDDIMGLGPIWCRGATGQSISLDSVICGIYNECHKENDSE